MLVQSGWEGGKNQKHTVLFPSIYLLYNVQRAAPHSCKTCFAARALNVNISEALRLPCAQCPVECCRRLPTQDWQRKTRHTTYVVFGRAETNRRTATAAFYFAMLPRMCTKPNESRSQKIQGKTSRPCRRLHSYVKVTGKAICLLTWHDEQQLTYNSTYTCTVYIYIVKSCEQMIIRYDMCYKMKKYVEV